MDATLAKPETPAGGVPNPVKGGIFVVRRRPRNSLPFFPAPLLRVRTVARVRSGAGKNKREVWVAVGFSTKMSPLTGFHFPGTGPGVCGSDFTGPVEARTSLVSGVRSSCFVFAYSGFFARLVHSLGSAAWS